MDNETKKQKQSLLGRIQEDLLSRTDQFILPLSFLISELGKSELLITIGRIFLVPSLIAAGLTVLFASPFLSTFEHLYQKKKLPMNTLDDTFPEQNNNIEKTDLTSLQSKKRSLDLTKDHSNELEERSYKMRRK